ncbi:MAG: DUF885 family protein [Alphaproteobacteria bacterium]|nr:DUF885 family protein [Alphaproteobacteria bacterium]
MISRRDALAGAAAVAALAAAGQSAEAKPRSADAALAEMFEKAFEAQLDRSPQLATSLGDKRNYGKWNDVSDAAADASVRASVDALAKIKRKIKADKLSADSRLSLTLFEQSVSRSVANQKWRRYGYVFNQMGGVQSTTPTFLINQHKVATVSDAEAYVERLRGMPAYLDAQVARSEANAAAGVLPPKHIFDYVLPAARNVVKGAPFTDGPDSPLFADLKAKVGRIDAPEAVKAKLVADGAAALKDGVAPAYARMIAAIESQKARAGTDAGVWRFKDGDAYYADRLADMTTTKLSAAEIHQIGLDNVARIHGEMRAIMAKVGFSGDLDKFFDFMETDPRFFLPQTADGKAEYIKRATAAIAAMNAKVPQYFNRLPKAPMEVRAVEPFREQAAGLAFYERPSADGSRPGVYYANTIDMKALPTYQIEALAFHEGIPGHHFQIALAQELDGLPRFRRFGGYTAFSEGWGLYAERLGKDMGFYEDPYSDFGRLTLEVRRAIRLVVDTGLHAKRWSREQAVQYILDNQPGDRAQAEKDIDRYIVMPGQATAYMIGQQEILRLREKARTAMGAKFDIRGFHDVVLTRGAVPLDVLAANVDAWIAA